MIGTRLDHHIIHTGLKMTTTNWNILYGIHYGNHMVDSLTDTVFFSDLLPERCPTMYQSLDKILRENHIDHRLLRHTKDIWCRDYMPIQTSGKSFVFYKYNPDYLQTKYYKRTITNVDRVGNIECLRQDGEVFDLDLVIDGGNVVRCDDKIVMTEKVFFENKDKSRNEVQRLLEEAFECDIIFLPWDRKEIFGHSDGIVHYVGDNRVLMTNYADFDAAKSNKILNLLEKHVEVIPLRYNVKRKHERSWAYINFLQIGNLVLVPQLGIPEDEQALQQIRDAMPRCKVMGVPALEAVRKGGALNCISWNVATTQWNSGFMGEEYKVHGRPVSWIKKAAEKGYRQWQCNLGICLFYGNGVEKDIVAANQWYGKSAEQGCDKAQFNLGLSYYKGEGVVKDYTKAMHWFKKASEQGDADAQLHIGRCLEEMNASNEDIVAAYKKSAEMGNPEAMYFLGKWCQYGDKGLTVDIQESFRWWKKAAEIGCSQAQCAIGDCYDFGKGAAEDKIEALKWYKRSASKDYIPAVYVLGLCYYYGNGIRKNKREALRYFRRAAKNEYAAAVCMIGEYYYYGYIVDEDEEEAVKYFKRAAELGNERAAEILSRILLKNKEPRLEDLPF
jgi:TPR repeat protein